MSVHTLMFACILLPSSTHTERHQKTEKIRGEEALYAGEKKEKEKQVVVIFRLEARSERKDREIPTQFFDDETLEGVKEEKALAEM